MRDICELKMDELQKKLKNMSTSLLFAELDDTIMLDLLKMNQAEWAQCKEKRLYLAIIAELRGRINET